MQKRTNLRLIVVVILVGIIFPASVLGGTYGGGTGEPNDPYLISEPNHMQEIGANPNDWDKHFRLTADIDLSAYTGTEFNIIGPNCNNYFSGVFDGNNHTISNFTFYSPVTSGIDYVGLFGCIGGNAEIKDLGLVDPNVSSDDCVGALVGILSNGTVTDCFAVGGNVTGDLWVGGLMGYNSTMVKNSYATNCVSGRNFVGGLVGMIHKEGLTTNSYATGAVNGDLRVGGLIGENRGLVSYSYSTGAVSGNTETSGLIGSSQTAIVSSYWDIETSGQAESGAGTGKTTAEMKMASTFIGWGNCDAAWVIDEGNDYPHLVWENTPGVLIENALCYGGGSGEPNDPYLISTVEQLNAIGLSTCDWDKHFKLTSDIDLDGFTLNIIGSGVSIPFTGVFNGNGHTISNFSCDLPVDGHYIGLFSSVGENAEIKDLGLVDPNVNGHMHVGALVGWLEDGTVTGCFAVGGSVTSDSRVGGLVGSNSGGTINNSYASGAVTGGYATGGLAGDNYDNTTIVNSYATGTVTGDRGVGGLAGFNSEGVVSKSYATSDVYGNVSVGGLVGENTDTVNNSYATGSVTGDLDVGGLVGRNWEGTVGTVSNSYASGAVHMPPPDPEFPEYPGGLVGNGNPGSVNNSFWDVNTSGCPTSKGGTGLSTVEMMDENTFTSAGWDFNVEPVWMICDGTNYPKLAWQIPPLGDFDCPNGIDFIDFSILASAWLTASGEINWNQSCDISDPNDGVIDELDLAVFCENWLEGF